MSSMGVAVDDMLLFTLPLDGIDRCGGVRRVASELSSIGFPATSFFPLNAG
jgi:hypothetical protein